MSQLAKYLMLMSGIVIFFWLSGLVDDTVTGTFLNLLLNPEGFKNTALFLKVLTVFEVALLGGVTALAIIQKNDLLLVTPVVILMVTFLWDFYSIISKVFSQNYVLGIIIFSPIVLLYALALIEWWRGSG